MFITFTFSLFAQKVALAINLNDVVVITYANVTTSHLMVEHPAPLHHRHRHSFHSCILLSASRAPVLALLSECDHMLSQLYSHLVNHHFRIL